jgi:hypothetical protein
MEGILANFTKTRTFRFFMDSLRVELGHRVVVNMSVIVFRIKDGDFEGQSEKGKIFEKTLKAFSQIRR